MRQCSLCNRPAGETSAYCSFCEADVRSQRKQRNVKRLWIGFASLLTIGGVGMTGSYVANPPPLFLSEAMPHNFLFVNRWTLMLAWIVIFFVWSLVPREDRFP
jgi:hypothetical protein